MFWEATHRCVWRPTEGSLVEIRDIVHTTHLHRKVGLIVKSSSRDGFCKLIVLPHLHQSQRSVESCAEIKKGGGASLSSSSSSSSQLTASVHVDNLSPPWRAARKLEQLGGSTLDALLKSCQRDADPTTETSEEIDYQQIPSSQHGKDDIIDRLRRLLVVPGSPIQRKGQGSRTKRGTVGGCNVQLPYHNVFNMCNVSDEISEEERRNIEYRKVKMSVINARNLQEQGIRGANLMSSDQVLQFPEMKVESSFVERYLKDSFKEEEEEEEEGPMISTTNSRRKIETSSSSNSSSSVKGGCNSSYQGQGDHDNEPQVKNSDKADINIEVNASPLPSYLQGAEGDKREGNYNDDEGDGGDDEKTTTESDQVRKDPVDGMGYTKAEFRTEYGDLEKWNKAVRIPSASARRLDMHDQKPYTFKQFKDFYRSDREWRRAPFASSSSTEQEAPGPGSGGHPFEQEVQFDMYGNPVYQQQHHSYYQNNYQDQRTSRASAQQKENKAFEVDSQQESTDSDARLDRLAASRNEQSFANIHNSGSEDDDVEKKRPYYEDLEPKQQDFLRRLAQQRYNACKDINYMHYYSRDFDFFNPLNRTEEGDPRRNERKRRRLPSGFYLRDNQKEAEEEIEVEEEETAADDDSATLGDDDDPHLRTEWLQTESMNAANGPGFVHIGRLTHFARRHASFSRAFIRNGSSPSSSSSSSSSSSMDGFYLRRDDLYAALTEIAARASILIRNVSDWEKVNTLLSESLTEQASSEEIMMTERLPTSMPTLAPHGGADSEDSSSDEEDEDDEEDNTEAEKDPQKRFPSSEEKEANMEIRPDDQIAPSKQEEKHISFEKQPSSYNKDEKMNDLESLMQSTSQRGDDEDEDGDERGAKDDDFEHASIHAKEKQQQGKVNGNENQNLLHNQQQTTNNTELQKTTTIDTDGAQHVDNSKSEKNTTTAASNSRGNRKQGRPIFAEYDNTDDVPTISGTTTYSLKDDDEIVKYSSSSSTDASAYTYTYTSSDPNGGDEAPRSILEWRNSELQANPPGINNDDDINDSKMATRNASHASLMGGDSSHVLTARMKAQVRKQADALLDLFGTQHELGSKERKVNSGKELVLPVQSLLNIFVLALNRACISVLRHQEFVTAVDISRQFLGEGRTKRLAKRKTKGLFLRVKSSGDNEEQQLKYVPSFREVEPLPGLWGAESLIEYEDEHTNLLFQYHQERIAKQINIAKNHALEGDMSNRKEEEDNGVSGNIVQPAGNLGPHNSNRDYSGKHQNNGKDQQQQLKHKQQQQQQQQQQSDIFPLYPGEMVMVVKGSKSVTGCIVRTHAGNRYSIRVKKRMKAQIGELQETEDQRQEKSFIITNVPREAIRFVGTWEDLKTIALFFRTLKDIADAHSSEMPADSNKS